MKELKDDHDVKREPNYLDLLATNDFDDLDEPCFKLQKADQELKVPDSTELGDEQDLLDDDFFSNLMEAKEEPVEIILEEEEFVAETMIQSWERANVTNKCREGHA